jgi:hypothetical protein
MLPPGTQSAIVSAHAHHAASLTSAYTAVQSTRGYRNAALLELADQLLGEISDAAVTVRGIPTIARKVLISSKNLRHAIERRQVSSQEDADLVALRLSEALLHPRFWLAPQSNPNVYLLIGFSPSADKCIKFPLKLVPAIRAATKIDEWWCQTAMPFGSEKFREASAKGLLSEIQRGSLPANFER